MPSCFASGSSARTTRRKAETLRRETAPPNSLDRPHPRSLVGCTDPDALSLPYQAAKRPSPWPGMSGWKDSLKAKEESHGARAKTSRYPCHHLGRRCQLSEGHCMHTWKRLTRKKANRIRFDSSWTAGTPALALGNLIRLHRILAYQVVSKFFRPDIVMADARRMEQVGHRSDISDWPDIVDKSVESDHVTREISRLIGPFS